MTLRLALSFILVTASAPAFAGVSSSALDTAALNYEILQDGSISGLGNYHDSVDIYLPDHAPLSNNEALAFAFYTGNGYKNIDAYLQNGKPDRGAAVRLLDEGLAKLPFYSGDVYHMQTMAPQRAAQLHAGMILNFPAYLSCSKSLGVFAGNVEFIIHQQDGHDISNYSINPQETEVLLPHGVRLRLDSVETSDGQSFTIHATQL